MKKIAIHQPNFIPWCGYFYKMISSDIFILLDDVKYSKNNIINRNKLKNETGEFWITIPITKNSDQLINEVETPNKRWQNKLIETIKNRYSSTPYFSKYEESILSLLNERNQYLIVLNINFINLITELLHIETRIILSSNFKSQLTGDNRLIDLIKQNNGNSYISGSGGNKYQDLDKFKKENIEVIFSKFNYKPYTQKYGEFIPNLSILDLLFNLGAKKTLEYITINGQLKELRIENKE